MTSYMQVNVPLITKSIVYAEGPVIVQGIDVKQELMRNRELINKILGETEDLEKVTLFIYKELELDDKEQKSKLEQALDMLKATAEAKDVLEILLGVVASLSTGNTAILTYVLTHDLLDIINLTKK